MNGKNEDRERKIIEVLSASGEELLPRSIAYRCGFSKEVARRLAIDMARRGLIRGERALFKDLKSFGGCMRKIWLFSVGVLPHGVHGGWKK